MKITSTQDFLTDFRVCRILNLH